MTQIKGNKRGSQIFTEGSVKLQAIKSKALDVDCFRGFAKLSDLSKISSADEYNEITHKDGIQRNLSKPHAREAYTYAAKKIPGEKRIWPEVILNLRRRDGIKIKGHSSFKGLKDMVSVTIRVNLKEISINNTDPTFSRVDGNHRLFYGGGIDKKNLALDVIVPFCILDGLSRQEERLIFKTINDKQKKLATDHILRIKGQTMEEYELMRKDPALWVTTQLREQNDSPFFGIVHIAGPKQKGAYYIIKQRSLYDGIKILLRGLESKYKQPEQLNNLINIIINYFSAVNKRWVNEWKDSKKYLLMSNTGLQALGLVGSNLIVSQIKKQKVKEDDFLAVLKTVIFKWDKVQDDGERLPTGRAGGETISSRILTSMDTGVVDLSQLETN